ncbi:hypothetical protein [Corynebacterium variabile]|uniref:Uncharacterized protein n=1 Tax=Corynebacterium variabile TaxID=1727 RepID=A0A0X2NMI2_9CORY|nr:hypothetical protein [Corynebacterium variabile]CUU66695.1 hypothetical protein CVAR292_02042 [Corynebacterium variabile]
MTVRIHPRVAAKHPEISDDDVRSVFMSALRSRARDTDPVQWVGVGIDGNGRILEFNTVETGDGDWLVFHAMLATKKVLQEIGLRR